MNKIKVIVMDVDDTLFSSKKCITQETKEALMIAQANGIRLILASGRPTTGLIELGKELKMDKHHGLFVSYNGSKVIDCETMETLFNESMTIEEGKAVLEHMKKFDVYPMIDKDKYMYVNNVFAPHIHINGEPFNVIEYESRGGNYLLCEKEDLASFADFEINKILTTGEPDYLQKVYKEMESPFKETLSCMFTSSFYFEFTAKGIDKAKALDSVLKPLGFNEENLIGFGDGMNDLSMLKYCGTAIAMGNAVDIVKETANFITTSNDADGIAKALYKYIPEIYQ